MLKILTYISLLALLACEPIKRNSEEELYLVPLLNEGSYDLKSPIDKFYLPYVLEEISGMSFIKSGILASVQDEKGKLFLYDLKTRGITRSVEFGKSGDYEGVEVVGDTAYAVKSNGDIYQFDILTNKPQVSVMETALSQKNNIEGLAYDFKSNRLLLVCKNNSDIGNKRIKGKAVFEYDLSVNKLSHEPVFTIDKDDLKSFYEMKKDRPFESKQFNFKPSGIALHPIQDKYYVLAHVGKMLLVVSRSGEIEASYPIASNILGQPEGICFAPNGDMFIASEGDGDKGFVLKFEMVKE